VVHRPFLPWRALNTTDPITEGFGPLCWVHQHTTNTTPQTHGDDQMSDSAKESGWAGSQKIAEFWQKPNDALSEQKESQRPKYLAPAPLRRGSFRSNFDECDHTYFTFCLATIWLPDAKEPDIFWRISMKPSREDDQGRYLSPVVYASKFRRTITEDGREQVGLVKKGWRAYRRHINGSQTLGGMIIALSLLTLRMESDGVISKDQSDQLIHDICEDLEK